MADLGTVRLPRTLRTRTTFCGPRMRYLALVLFDVESGGTVQLLQPRTARVNRDRVPHGLRPGAANLWRKSSL
jgi:hypothetical protein